MNKLVSVIITAYNVEKYIGECIKSIRKQSYKNVEIIVVNDGSTDKTLNKIKFSSLFDKRIKIVNKENGGVSSARNAGMELVTGDYLLFVDGDDCLEKSAIENMIEYFEECDLDILLHDASVFYDGMSKSETSITEDRYTRNFAYNDVVSGIKMFEDMRHNCEFSSCVWSMMFKTSFLKDNNISFKEGIWYEDNLFAFECMILAKNVLHIDDKLYLRRVRPGSIMTKPKTIKDIYCHYILLDEIDRVNKKYKVKELGESFYNDLMANCKNIYNSLSEEEKCSKQYDDDKGFKKFVKSLNK